MAALAVENLHAYYGHIHALHGVTIHVESGEIVTLIGANGAGKSTTLKTIGLGPAGFFWKAGRSMGSARTRLRAAASVSCRKAGACSRA